jgi:putative flippase GtrA
MSPREERIVSNEVDAVVHVAVSAALSDFAALLMAYGWNQTFTDDIIQHAQNEVVRTLKNSSASNLSLELQAIALFRAVQEVELLMRDAIQRSRKANA